jgi:hypothetical protein
VILIDLLAAVQLLFVHGPDGQMLELNIDQISSIREPRATEGHFHKDVKCIIIMSNNRLVAIVETCNDVLNYLQAQKLEK